MPLNNINSTEPETMITTIKLVKSLSEQAGQEYAVFTNDQQLFKIAARVAWYKPDEGKDFFQIRGGMHTLMSFVGCIGILMANTGLSHMIKSAFGGFEEMVSGKKFPQNTRALRINVEEILRSILQDESVSDCDSMMVLLNSLAKKSRTTHLWLKALIWPVILIMRFIRASRETEWPFHIHTLS